MRQILNENGIELKPALFMHIQKTAGTSIVDQAAKHYGNTNVSSHGDFVNRSPADFVNVPFISGHFGYDFARTLMPSRYSFVFLRDPVERILSYYYFCRSRDPNEFEMYKKAQDLGLDSFLQYALESPFAKPRVWNNQTWQLAHGYGKQDDRSINSFDSNELLSLATQHLKKFSFVGFTETFDSDNKVVLKSLGIAENSIQGKSNATVGKPESKELPSPTRKLLDRLTELDRELYEYAWSHSKKNFFQRLFRRG